jgi:hypothetical protein
VNSEEKLLRSGSSCTSFEVSALCFFFQSFGGNNPLVRRSSGVLTELYGKFSALESGVAHPVRGNHHIGKKLITEFLVLLQIPPVGLTTPWGHERRRRGRRLRMPLRLLRFVLRARSHARPAAPSGLLPQNRGT